MRGERDCSRGERREIVLEVKREIVLEVRGEREREIVLEVRGERDCPRGEGRERLS